MKIKEAIIHNSLFIILTIAAVLRLWNLGNVPPSLNQDEASLGYNAYSILKTGKDEYGKTLPVIFKSFGDYKPGLYVYLDVPFVAVLGLNELSTRLPSALAGVLSVYLLYLIVRSLFTNHQSLATIATFVAATNPWLIYFSRAAWEANVSLTLTLAGIYFFLKAFEKNEAPQPNGRGIFSPASSGAESLRSENTSLSRVLMHRVFAKGDKYLILSSLSLSLTLTAYQGAKLSTAIVVALLILIYWKEFWKIEKKYIFSSVVSGALIAAPIIISLFNGQATRLGVYSIFSYKRPVGEVSAFLAQGGEKLGDLGYYIFHSEGLNYTRAILGRWFNNFSGRFLFFEGDWANPISTSVYQGILLLCDIIFLPLGFIFAFSSKSAGKKAITFFLLWLALSPFSSALARDEINAVRNLNMAIPLIVFVSMGVVFTLSRLKPFLRVSFFIFYLLSIIYFIDSYFVHVPAHNSVFWRYGYKEAIELAEKYGGDVSGIVFEQSFNQPYIYFLYYQKIDTRIYQATAKLSDSGLTGDVGFVTKLGNIEFAPIDWQVLKKSSDTLIVASPTSLPPEAFQNPDQYKILGEVQYLNKRDTAFVVLKIL